MLEVMETTCQLELAIWLFAKLEEDVDQLHRRAFELSYEHTQLVECPRMRLVEAKEMMRERFGRVKWTLEGILMVPHDAQEREQLRIEVVELRKRMKDEMKNAKSLKALIENFLIVEAMERSTVPSRRKHRKDRVDTVYGVLPVFETSSYVRRLREGHGPLYQTSSEEQASEGPGDTPRR